MDGAIIGAAVTLVGLAVLVIYAFNGYRKAWKEHKERGVDCSWKF